MKKKYTVKIELVLESEHDVNYLHYSWENSLCDGPGVDPGSVSVEVKEVV